MTVIGFVRHGSTAWNQEGRAQGQANNLLDEDGLDQARALAERLLTESWDVIYASDLARAKQTAEILGEKLGIAKIHYDERLRELHVGLIEGTTAAERVAKWGANWKDADLGRETPEQGAIRGSASIEEIAAKHPTGHVLVISHGNLIQNSLKRLTPALDVTGSLKNTSLTTIKRIGDKWHCELYNCAKHLGI